jgi:putative phage-type endonuclease
MEQRSAEWFAARKGKITGSRVGGILGVNQYKTRDGVMREMVREWFDAPSEFTGNAATDHGTAMEPEALAFYKTQLLPEVADVEEVGFIPHPRLDFVGASPDGLLQMQPGINWRGGLEIKCPYYAKTVYSIFDPKKASYAAQMQLVMEVCDLDCMDFLCYFSPENFLLETLERDRNWWADAEPKLQAFHEEFKSIVANKKRAAPYLQDGDPEVDDPRVGELSTLFFKIKANAERMKPTTDRFDELKKELSKEFGIGTGEGVRFATQTKKGAVDWKRLGEVIGISTILAANGDSLDNYRKPDTASVIVEAAK